MIIVLDLYCYISGIKMMAYVKALFIAAILVTNSCASLTVSEDFKRATNDAIEKYRKGDVNINVYDDKGKSISGASINYKQMSRDFLFGVAQNTRSRSEWMLLEEAGINYAHVYMTWRYAETPDKWSRIEWVWNLKLLRDLKFVFAGHNLVWMASGYSNIPGYSPYNLPIWAMDLGYDELKAKLYDHVYNTVSHFKSEVSYWVINEPFFTYNDAFNLTHRQWIEICKISVQAIKKAHPEGKIIMANLIGDIPNLNYYPIRYMKALMDKGVEFDIIGLQVYGAGRSPGIPSELSKPLIPSVSRRLDQFAKLGKPIILTEVCVPADPNEGAQAEWLRDLYSIAFSKPYLKGIVWTYVSDYPFIPKGGLLNTAREPRQAYYALKHLTHSWLTEGNGTTESAGRLSFRGFSGYYSITVTADGFKPLETTIHIKEQVENTFDLYIKKGTGVRSSFLKTLDGQIF